MDIRIIKIIENLQKKRSDRIIINLKEYLSANRKKVIFNWHPLGFVHSKLASIEPLGDLRLHVWLNDLRMAQTPYMPIHDHIFDVNSFILKGIVTNNIYDINMDGNTHKKYKASYNSSGSTLKPTDKTLSYKLINSSKYQEGDHYTVKKGIYHQTTVDINSFAATLVLTTNKDDGGTPNILGPVQNREYQYKRSMCDAPIIDILNKKL